MNHALRRVSLRTGPSALCNTARGVRLPGPELGAGTARHRRLAIRRHILWIPLHRLWLCALSSYGEEMVTQRVTTVCVCVWGGPLDVIDELLVL